MPNGIHEKAMSKNYRAKANNFPGGTSATILENIDQLVTSKPNCLIVHAGTNDLANRSNLLNKAKKIVKQVKKVSQNNQYCIFEHYNPERPWKYRQKGFTGKLIFKKLLQSKKYRCHRLHLNKKGNSILANNFLKYLTSNFWNSCTDSNCSRINDVDCISELSEVNTEDVSFKSNKDIRIKNLNRIILALNINSSRKKLDLLVDQIKENVDVLAISETKLDDSFPAGLFKIPSYASPFRIDRNQNGGGILVFVSEDIPVKVLSSEEKLTEAFFFERNFHKK